MLGVYLEGLGASLGDLGRSLNVPRGVFGDPWRSLGGPREVTGDPCTSLGGSLRVLGGPWEVLGRSQGVLGGACEAPKTDEVFSEGLEKVLGSSWGGFGALGWSLSRSWEVKMLLFRRY